MLSFTTHEPGGHYIKFNKSGTKTMPMLNFIFRNCKVDLVDQLVDQSSRTVVIQDGKDI